MKKIIIAAAAAAISLGLTASTAHAGPSMCDIQKKLGYQNVQDCNGTTS